MKVLYIVPYAPSTIRSRPYELILQLVALGHHLTLATPVRNGDTSNEGRWAVDPRVRIVTGSLSRFDRLLALGGAAVRGLPLQARFDWSTSFAHRLRRLVDAETFDVVHVEHMRGAAYGLPLLRRTPVVWDSVDCISDLFERAARQSASRQTRWIARAELGRTRRYESSLPWRFDHTVVTSAADRDGLLRLAARRRRANRRAQPRVSVVQQGVDAERFMPALASAHRDPETVVMTGKMSYHANVTAAQFLVQAVMPIVWSSCPTARVVLAGADPSPEVRALGAANPDRVVVTGFVDDLNPILNTASVAVAPLVYGVGMQNKVLEAMACGTATIVTSGAASALHARDGHELLVADGAEKFASQILELFSWPERARSIGAAGRAYVVSEHTWAKSAEVLAGVYESAIEARALSGT